MKNQNTLIILANSVKKRLFGGLLAAGMMLAASSPALAGGNHIGSNIQVLPRTTPSGIPVSNGLLGDSNPYGVQFVPQNFMGGHGMLQTNDVLVSNYNNTTVQLGNTVSTQGLGTTITRIRPDGQGSVFFNSTEMGVTGFTNALDILPRGLILRAQCQRLTEPQRLFTAARFSSSTGKGLWSARYPSVTARTLAFMGPGVRPST